VVIVDTSIWIDFFQYPESIYQEKLEELVTDNNQVIICGIILQEVLQGIKDQKDYEITRQRLTRLPFLNTNKETYLYASALYRKLRSEGITIPSVDITIAALAILNDLPLFTKDVHFRVIARYTQLELY
jgi:hypothetical protein